MCLLIQGSSTPAIPRWWLSGRKWMDVFTYSLFINFIYNFSTIFSRGFNSLSSLFYLSTALLSSLSSSSSTRSRRCLLDGTGSSDTDSCSAPRPSGSGGTQSGEADAETGGFSPQADAMRQGGWIDGLPPVASSMRGNHFRVPAVGPPDSVSLSVGGFLSSCTHCNIHIFDVCN